MTLETYRPSALKRDRLRQRGQPEAANVVRSPEESIPAELWKIICRAEIAAKPDPSWNLLKVHTRESRADISDVFGIRSGTSSCLSRSDQDQPNTGSIVRTDFRQRANPPILHRKETFLPPNDPQNLGMPASQNKRKRRTFIEIRRRIGLRVQWLAPLKRLNLHYQGHTLISRPLTR